MDNLISEIEKLYKLTPVQETLGAGPSVDYRADDFRGTLGFIAPVTRHFCESCNRIRVTSDGRIRGCLFSDAERDILPLLRGKRDLDLSEIGDFIKKSLEEKPLCHDISGAKFRSCQRSMSKIGG